jgi:hypothetical protein
MKKFPNTYTMSKSIAEHLIALASSNLPVSIVRPSVVNPPTKDPSPGYLDTEVGSIPVVLATSSGILKLLNGDENNRLDLIPVDCVINTMLLVIVHQITNKISFTIFTSGSYRNPIKIGYYFATNINNIIKKPLKNNLKEMKSHSKVIDENPLQQPLMLSTNNVDSKVMIDTSKALSRANHFASMIVKPPMVKKTVTLPQKQETMIVTQPKEKEQVTAVVIPQLTFIKNTKLFNAMYFINNILPLYWIRDQKTKAKQERVNRYLDKLYANYTHFTMNYWLFTDNNTQHLTTLLSKKDQQAFGFNIMDVNWDSYINDLTNGVREFVNRPRAKL